MKRGSTIIESIISLAIILITISLSFQITSITINSITLRKNKEKGNRIAYAIENEIKYNFTITELETLFNNNLSLKYSDNIMENISKKSLLLLERGNDIIIEKIKDESTEENYRIYVYRVKILSPKGGIMTEREFIKSYWMDI
ncbi:type II secretion system protein [Clostridium sp. Sa3CUN1]|uniref:Type II secretion system protein n=1 Tax=Clostridium gallinarum TaxID=2762246 RepID=A0ABR8Q834_9CLOT|nr:type II secretion system protein [Clostridium gallinarum]MBD7916585.1 type II secretion system protein [Clostridium gallinarum]